MGNTLLLEDMNRAHGSKATVSLSSLSYNGVATIPDVNKLSIRYQIDKISAVKTFEQKFEARGIVKMLLSYDPQTNRTTVTIDKQKTEVDGIQILQITTDRGVLRYGYVSGGS